MNESGTEKNSERVGPPQALVRRMQGYVERFVGSGIESYVYLVPVALQERACTESGPIPKTPPTSPTGTLGLPHGGVAVRSGQQPVSQALSLGCGRLTLPQLTRFHLRRVPWAGGATPRGRPSPEGSFS